MPKIKTATQIATLNATQNATETATKMQIFKLQHKKTTKIMNETVIQMPNSNGAP